jgi:hypothetical protein
LACFGPSRCLVSRPPSEPAAVPVFTGLCVRSRAVKGPSVWPPFDVFRRHVDPRVFWLVRTPVEAPADPNDSGIANGGYGSLIPYGKTPCPGRLLHVGDISLIFGPPKKLRPHLSGNVGILPYVGWADSRALRIPKLLNPRISAQGSVNSASSRRNWTIWWTTFAKPP